MASHSNRSTARESLILALPSLAALALGAATGRFVDAVTAVGLVLPVMALSHSVMIWWSDRPPAFILLGMVGGVIARVMVIVGGGVALCLLTDEYRSRGVALWTWVVGIYLATLAVELALNVRGRPKPPQGDHGSSR